MTSSRSGERCGYFHDCSSYIRLRSERDAAVARAEAAEAQHREFIDGLTAKLNAAGVPTTPTWPDVFRYLVARAERYGDALHDIAQGETVPMWAKLRAREALGKDA